MGEASLPGKIERINRMTREERMDDTQTKDDEAHALHCLTEELGIVCKLRNALASCAHTAIA